MENSTKLSLVESEFKQGRYSPTTPYSHNVHDQQNEVEVNPPTDDRQNWSSSAMVEVIQCPRLVV